MHKWSVLALRIVSGDGYSTHESSALRRIESLPFKANQAQCHARLSLQISADCLEGRLEAKECVAY